MSFTGKELTSPSAIPTVISATVQHDNSSSNRKRPHPSDRAVEEDGSDPVDIRHPPKRRRAMVPRSHEYMCAAQVGMEFVLDSFQLSSPKSCGKASEVDGDNGVRPPEAPLSNIDEERTDLLGPPIRSPDVSVSPQQPDDPQHEDDDLLEDPSESDTSDSEDD